MKRIFVSSVLPRVQSLLQKRRFEVNNILRRLCEDYGFHFVENDNMTLRDHICHDGTHLNVDGTIQLARNYLFALNNVKFRRNASV